MAVSAVLIQRKRALVVVYSTGKVEALELRVPPLEESEGSESDGPTPERRLR
jgi:hypothetical protein